jgi:hypothetical protein
MVFMNKRKIVIIALIAFFVLSVVVVYAVGDPSFDGKGTTTLEVYNPYKKTVSGTVCVTFENPNNGKSATRDVDYKVAPGKTKYYPIPGKILYWSSTMCYLLDE